MEVSHKYIGDIIPLKPCFIKGRIQGMIPPSVVIAKKFIGLFIPQTCINKDEPISILNKKASGGNIYHIIVI
jgi:hypothetical protein